MKGRRLPRGVYRRRDVLWIRFKNADGKLTRESTGQGDVKVAESILAKRRSAVAMLTHFPTRKFEQLTFDDLREAWEPAHLKKTPSFRYLLPRVLAAFGGAKAREMTSERVQEFLDRLRDDDGLSASSVNHYRTILNSIFNEAIRHGRYDVNPIRAIHQFREPPGRDRFLSVEEFQLLLAKCKDPELRTAILVLCMTTLRLRELLNRRWSEMHLEGPAPYVSVPHTKTGVPKKAPLPRVAVEALKSLPSYGLDDYVFPSKSSARWPSPIEAPPVGSREGVPGARAFARNGGRAAPRPPAYRTVRALDAGHSWRRGAEDYGPPVPRAGALPAPLAGVPSTDGRFDRPGFV
jgi:integrase